MRAVHRFEHVAINFTRFHHVGQFTARAAFVSQFFHEVALDERRVLRILVVREVARGSVKVQLSNVWCKHLRIALSSEVMGNEILQFLANDGATRRPKDEALTDFFVDVEELQVLAQLSVVPLFGLLKTRHRCLEGLFGRLNHAVDADQLLTVLVASPVRRGHGGQSHKHQFGRAWHVGAEAQVVPFALLVDG